MKLWELPYEPATFENKEDGTDDNAEITFQLLHGTTPLTCMLVSYELAIMPHTLVNDSFDVKYRENTSGGYYAHSGKIFRFANHGMKVARIWKKYGATGTPEFLLSKIREIATAGKTDLTICGPFQTLRRAMRSLTRHQVLLYSATPFTPARAEVHGEYDRDAMKRLLEAYKPHGWAISHGNDCVQVARWHLRFEGNSYHDTGHEKAERLEMIEKAIRWAANKPPHVITNGRCNL